ncbi:hypothetical protein H4R20_000575 [Coemansia guatemalensis]|uniref:S1-like domain-containing protein n=1 Tax=Coemansia guatemalensis TaxID=2761395 RepID=A0A9W8I0V2_9FUNG|nr:hypothetical protein H4R20_000575 [Coemansia guatemalensis]
MGRGKYAAQEALDAQAQPSAMCPVACVLGPRGQHLHEIAVAQSLVTDEINKRLNPDGKALFTTLAQLPPKFRSIVWVKRGKYVIVDLEKPLTDKIGGEITMVLLAAQVKQLKQADKWPTQYANVWSEISGQASSSQPHDQHADNSHASSDDDSELVGDGNPNRRAGFHDMASDSGSSDEDSD